MKNEQPAFRIRKQNFSGVNNFYRNPPMRTYVVEVELNSPVQKDVLQEALNTVLKRMRLRSETEISSTQRIRFPWK